MRSILLWTSLLSWQYAINIYNLLNDIDIDISNYVKFVKISYARLDIISVQSKFTTITYAKSLKETQSQDRHNIYPGKPSRGRKPSKTSYV